MKKNSIVWKILPLLIVVFTIPVTAFKPPVNGPKPIRRISSPKGFVAPATLSPVIESPVIESRTAQKLPAEGVGLITTTFAPIPAADMPASSEPMSAAQIPTHIVSPYLVPEQAISNEAPTALPSGAATAAAGYAQQQNLVAPVLVDENAEPRLSHASHFVEGSHSQSDQKKFVAPTIGARVVRTSHISARQKQNHSGTRQLAAPPVGKGQLIKSYSKNTSGFSPRDEAPVALACEEDSKNREENEQMNVREIVDLNIIERAAAVRKTRYIGYLKNPPAQISSGASRLNKDVNDVLKGMFFEEWRRILLNYKTTLSKDALEGLEKNIPKEWEDIQEKASKGCCVIL